MIRPGLPETLLGATVVAAPPAPVTDPIVLEMRDAEFHLVAAADHACIDITAVGTFGIERGRRVTVQPADDAEPGVLDVYLNGTIAALLLGQRSRFALHANAVAIDGTAVLVAGNSGSGKSTTAIRLLQRGHSHLGDDMCAIRVRDGRPTLEPSRRGLRVSPEAAASLGLDLEGARRPFASSDKLVLPVEPGPPAGLGAIAVLEAGGGAGLEVRRAIGAEALSHVLAHVYRSDFLLHIWPEELFAWAAVVADTVPVHVVTRPAGGQTIDEVATAVEGLAARG